MVRGGCVRTPIERAPFPICSQRPPRHFRHSKGGRIFRTTGNMAGRTGKLAVQGGGGGIVRGLIFTVLISSAAGRRSSHRSSPGEMPLAPMPSEKDNAQSHPPRLTAMPLTAPALPARHGRVSEGRELLGFCATANVRPQTDQSGSGGLLLRCGIRHFAAGAKVWVLPVRTAPPTTSPTSTTASPATQPSVTDRTRTP